METKKIQQEEEMIVDFEEIMQNINAEIDAGTMWKCGTPGIQAEMRKRQQQEKEDSQKKK